MIIRQRNVLQKVYFKVLEDAQEFINHRRGFGIGANPLDDGEENVYSLLSSDAVVFDVGANIGEYSAALLKKRPGAKIYAFEPVPSTYEHLTSRSLPIESINCGLSDIEGDAEIFFEKTLHAHSSLYPRSSLHEKIKVKLQTIDSFCEAREITHIDLLKIDVEGNELNVLRGAEKMLRADKIRMIQFEMGGANIDSGTFFKDFWDLLSPNYILYRILPKHFYEVKRYREDDEVFVTSNYLAIRKK